MRERYLDGLPFAQEYYLELLLQNANLTEIRLDNKPAGYFYLSPESCLLEYFIMPEWIQKTDLIFGTILKEFKVKSALCKTFDTPLLSSCFSHYKDSKAIGVLFRTYQETPDIHPPLPLSIRSGQPSDETRIISVNEEVFDHPSEVMEYIRANRIFIFESENNLVGFGIHSPVYPERLDHDIGMLVTTPFRGKGYGQFIVRYLVNFCHRNGWVPSAGCAIENTASRRCLEAAGFIADHRLIEFSFLDQHSIIKKRKPQNEYS